MSEREKKLEAALHIARQALQDNLTEIIWLKEMQQIDEALATPPTSEWNEAIEAAASVGTLYPSQRASIRALKHHPQVSDENGDV